MKTLVVVPSMHTKSRLQAIFMNCPYDIPWDQLLVPLAYNQPENLPLSRQEYFATFTQFRILTDEVRQQAELVGLLSSEDMRQRSIECGMSPLFEHKLIFLPYSPSQSTTVRSFNVSIADTLVMKEALPFTFSTEYLL
jgi:hypothetical protein